LFSLASRQGAREGERRHSLALSCIGDVMASWLYGPNRRASCCCKRYIRFQAKTMMTLPPETIDHALTLKTQSIQEWNTQYSNRMLNTTMKYIIFFQIVIIVFCLPKPVNCRMLVII
jgi:hypothetical protein